MSSQSLETATLLDDLYLEGGELIPSHPARPLTIKQSESIIHEFLQAPKNVDKAGRCGPELEESMSNLRGEHSALLCTLVQAADGRDAIAVGEGGHTYSHMFDRKKFTIHSFLGTQTTKGY